MNTITTQVRKELISRLDKEFAKGGQRFFKDKIKIRGVKAAKVREVSKQYLKDIDQMSNKEVYSLAEELMSSGYYEDLVVAFDFTKRIKNRFANKDFKTFERWLKKYVTNWAACDGFCMYIMSFFLEKYPSRIPNVKYWSKSKKTYVRRAAAVSFITSSKRGFVIQGDVANVFEISEALLHDPEDMVQKGYGWLLKVASQSNQKEVFDFLMKHKQNMPRTAFRYALEKMPQKLKDKAMKK